MSKSKGSFIVSLDFELYWGVHDQNYPPDQVNSYKSTRSVVLRLLAMFNEYDIHVTFSTVGFLFAENKAELKQHFPKQFPSYVNGCYSVYDRIENLSLEQENDGSVYFAWSLIDRIASCSNMEIGTHTFSHYYCLEDGQTIEEFKEDLLAAVSIAKSRNISIESIVFPRNQYSAEVIAICAEHGIKSYRGNERSWIYNTQAWSKEKLVKKGARFLDSFVNVSGHHGYELRAQKGNKIINLPASRFLRPHSPKLSFLNELKLRRIKKSMTYCAKNELTYHLWWHPHNFRIHPEKNFDFLERVLKHFVTLNETYRFNSFNMSEAANFANELG